MKAYFTKKRQDLVTEELFIAWTGEWTPALGKLFAAGKWICDLFGAES